MLSTHQAGEQLLSQLTSVVVDLCPIIDVKKLQIRISEILTSYDVRLLDLSGINQDLLDKIEMFLVAKKLEGLSSITLDGYLLDLKIFAQAVHKAADQVTTADIRTFLGRFQHLKLSSISKKLSVLKSFFGWLTEEEILQRDPTRKIKPPKKEQRLPKALSIEELEMLREGCQTLRQRAMVEALYATGCRLSEVHQMDRDGIDWRDSSVRVIGKGNKEREVYFSFKAVYHLKKYLKDRGDLVPALFITERKPYRRLSKRGIQREIALIARNAGLQKKVSPHSLRHTFATLTLNNGAELVAVQELLGHSKPDTTLVYAQLSEEKKREQHKKYLVQ